jgi:proteic killer suppression protein
MEVSFTNAKLGKLCNSISKLRGKYGPKMGPLIAQRLVEMDGADTLADLALLPGPRAHSLQENFKGHWAANLIHPYRLIFKPANDPLPKLPDDGLDTGRVTAVEVIGVVNYHKS